MPSMHSPVIQCEAASHDSPIAAFFKHFLSTQTLSILHFRLESHSPSSIGGSGFATGSWHKLSRHFRPSTQSSLVEQSPPTSFLTSPLPSPTDISFALSSEHPQANIANNAIAPKSRLICLSLFIDPPNTYTRGNRSNFLHDMPPYSLKSHTFPF